MTKPYQGKRDDGRWEQFEWDGVVPPTTEETGYTDIEEITLESTMEERVMENRWTPDREKK